MLSAAGEVSSTSSEIEPVSAIVTEACAPIATKEDEDATSERHEDPYIVKNAMAIYSWARFQEGAIKLSDVKEVYMTLDLVIIQRCIDYLVFIGKFKKADGQSERSRIVLYDVILPTNVFEETGDTDIPISDEENDDEGDNAQENKASLSNTIINVSKKRTFIKKRKAETTVVKEDVAPEPSPRTLSPPKFLNIERAGPACPVAESVLDFVMRIISDSGSELIRKDFILLRIGECCDSVEKDVALTSLSGILSYLEKMNRVFFMDDENICVL